MIQPMHWRKRNCNVGVLIRREHLKNVVINQALGPHEPCTCELLLIVGIYIALKLVMGIQVVCKKNVKPLAVGSLAILTCVCCVPA
jgi:hypothetical protein